MDPLPQYDGYQLAGFPRAARIDGWLGTPLVRADLSAIAYAVFDLDNANADTGHGALAVADVINDTLQVDARWDADALGYNFLWVVPGSCFPVGGHRYQVQLLFTPAAGQLIRDEFVVKTTTVIPTPA